MITEAERDTLEQMIDQHTLPKVLDALAIICDAKAEHVEEYWQDTRQALIWERAARVLERIIRYTCMELLRFD